MIYEVSISGVQYFARKVAGGAQTLGEAVYTIIVYY